MKIINKLTGDVEVIEHYSDHFSCGVNAYCEKLYESIFTYQAYRVSVKDVAGTLCWYQMTQDQFNNTNLQYKYYESLDFIKIKNFLDLLIDLEQADSIARNSEKGIKLFMSTLKEAWTSHVDMINDTD